MCTPFQARTSLTAFWHIMDEVSKAFMPVGTTCRVVAKPLGVALSFLFASTACAFLPAAVTNPLVRRCTSASSTRRSRVLLTG